MPGLVQPLHICDPLSTPTCGLQVKHRQIFRFHFVRPIGSTCSATRSRTFRESTYFTLWGLYEMCAFLLLLFALCEVSSLEDALREEVLAEVPSRQLQRCLSNVTIFLLILP